MWITLLHSEEWEAASRTWDLVLAMSHPFFRMAFSLPSINDFNMAALEYLPMWVVFRRENALCFVLQNKVF